MVERNYPALRETVWHTVLPNGLNVYVDTRPEYGKQFAFFAFKQALPGKLQADIQVPCPPFSI